MSDDFMCLWCFLTFKTEILKLFYVVYFSLFVSRAAGRVLLRVTSDQGTEAESGGMLPLVKITGL